MAYTPTPLPNAGLKSATTTGAPLPSAQVASYANQQVGQLNAGLGAGIISQSPTQLALSNAPKAQNAVQLSAQKRMDSVKASGERLTKLAQATQAKRVAATQKAGVGGGNPVGAAYKPDGTLSSSRNQALAQANSYVGTKYALGGTTTKGIDCSGLVMSIYNQLGYKLPHSARAQGQSIPGVRTSIANLRPGDLVAWKDGTHIAVYAGNGEIIEANGATGRTQRAKVYGNVYGIALRLPGE